MPELDRDARQCGKRRIAWDTISAFATAIAAICASVALILTAIQINDQREEARVRMLFERLHDFDGAEFVKVRKGLAKKRIDTTQQRLLPLNLQDIPSGMDDELNFCVDLGLLTGRNALDAHDVWSEFGYWLFPMYTDARSYVEDSRKDSPSTIGVSKTYKTAGTA
jgi:hypothetical protein